MVVSLVLNLALLAGAIIFLRRKFPFAIVPMLIGALSFILFALVLRPMIMINPLFLPRASVGAALITADNLLLFVLISTLASGLFEETGRMASFLFIKKKYPGFGTSISYGIGHGGSEVLILAVLTMVNNIVYSVLINSGQIALLSEIPHLEQIVAVLAATPPYMYLLSFAERVPAVAMHISWSVMVWYAVNKGGKAWLLYPAAIALHMLANTLPALMLAGVVTSIVLVEAGLYIIAAGIVTLAVVTHKKLSKGL
jgi:uncharacterized membrane protein YhfC